jgi:hypothetical protein
MENIKHIETYRAEMSKSMVDKLFFLDKIDVGLIVDFGCADGTMLKYVHEMRPDIELIGYDSSDEMIGIAKEQFDDGSGVQFTSDFNYIKEMLPICYSETKTAIILSSVIHEVYSYGNEESIQIFWNNLFDTGFDYIVIRDMLMSKNVNHDATNGDISKVYSSNNPHVEEFEEQWGKITNHKNLLHYLLKYRYNKNWFRELRENYLPITLEDLLNQIPTNKYKYEYYEHYILPFVQKSVKQEFGITLKDNTHIKLILKKK